MRNKVLEKRLRENGMIQQELADYLTERTGIFVSQTTVSSWINGKSNPREDFIDEMCELFSVNPEVIFPTALFFEEQKIKDKEYPYFTIVPSSPDEEVIRKEEINFLLKNFKKLSKMEIFVIGLHFGLEDGRFWTLEAIGRAMGKKFSGKNHAKGNSYTRERVRQIESSGIKKIRKFLSAT